MPSEKVGGDLVDVVALADGSACAYVADVAGHGLQAGILMGMLKTAARTRLLDQPGLDALFERLNRVMPEVKEANMYATCAALRISPPDAAGLRRIEYAIAGHPPILRVSEETGRAEFFSDEQLPLGLFLDAGYSSRAFSCCSGDLLLIATDGILEVETARGDQFGWGPVELLMRELHRGELPLLAARILESANAFGKQTDDQTLLLIRVL